MSDRTIRAKLLSKGTLRHEKLERLRAEIAKGEADFADGRFTEVKDDDELAAFFARL